MYYDIGTISHFVYNISKIIPIASSAQQTKVNQPLYGLDAVHCIWSDSDDRSSLNIQRVTGAAVCMMAPAHQRPLLDGFLFEDLTDPVFDSTW